MKTPLLISIIVASLTSLGCHTTKVVSPKPAPSPDVSDVLRSVSSGIALVTADSDVARSVPAYEYVVFPSSASRWNSHSRQTPADIYISDEAQECEPEIIAEPLAAAEFERTVTPEHDNIAAWTDYCSGKLLSPDQWEMLNTSHMPPSLARCCRNGCRR